MAGGADSVGEVEVLLGGGLLVAVPSGEVEAVSEVLVVAGFEVVGIDEADVVAVGSTVVDDGATESAVVVVDSLPVLHAWVVSESTTVATT